MSKLVPYGPRSSAEWSIRLNDDGTISEEQLQIVLLMDIREELRKLNQLLGCSNFTQLPQVLRTVRANTTTLVRLQKAKARS